MNSNDTGEFNDSEAFKRRRTSEASDSTAGMTSSHGMHTSKHLTEATLPHDGANSGFRRDSLTEPAPTNNNLLEDETKNVYNNDVMPNQSCTPMETASVGPNINETSSSSNLSSYTLPNRMSERTMGTISTSSSDLDHTLSSIASETVRATPIFTTADGVALPPIDPLLLARTRSLLFEDDDTDYSGGSREHNGNPRNNAAFVLSKMGHHQNAAFKSLPFVSPRVIQPRKDITKAAVDAKRNLNDSCRAQFRMPSARNSDPKDTKNVSISHNDSKPVVKRTKKILTLSELWHKNSTSTTHDMSNLSPAKLSEMWRQYGNPFCTNYDNALKFKYINYSTKDSSVTIGGVEEFHQCLKQWVEQMDECRAKKRKIFKEWFHEKYRLFTARKCRIYRRNIHKLMRNNHTLEDALLMVQLPKPLDILKRIQKVCDDEHRGKESTLTKIFYGDEQCNVPVVVTVEHVDGDHLKIADESSVFVAFAADDYVKEQIKNKRISRGTKIRLHGVRFVPDDYGDQMVELRFNQISPAANQRLGLQNRHTNVNIRELKIGGGSVAKMDVTILSICPPAYKVTYKEKETTVPKTVVLTRSKTAYMTPKNLNKN
uniref:Uncharacterized protein n=1 Tax=Babesia bovis TaxID=5865 RepID=A7ARP9_BABBO|eukprot:XP_001610786.1 hypothetical protein [Babesia bovis T2Bo]